MRLSSPPLILVSVFLLATFSGFSPPAIFGISIGATITLSGYVARRRIVSIAGFLIMAFSAAETASFMDLTIPLNILLTGVLFVLPLSFSLWFALTTESPLDERPKMNPVPYVWAILFVAVVLVSVPVTGIILHSTRFTTDVGIESEIMLIGFMTAMWSVALIGADTRN